MSGVLESRRTSAYFALDNPSKWLKKTGTEDPYGLIALGLGIVAVYDGVREKLGLEGLMTGEEIVAEVQDTLHLKCGGRKEETRGASGRYWTKKERAKNKREGKRSR